MTGTMIRTILLFTLFSVPLNALAGPGVSGGENGLTGTASAENIKMSEPDNAAQYKQLDLQSVIEIAIANNPQVAEAGYEADMAATRYDQSLAQVMPKIGLTGGYTHDMDEQRLNAPHFNGELGVFDDNISSLNIVLTQPLFTGGRIINEIKAARLLKQAASKQLSRTREELIFNVTSIFYSILSQREDIIALESSLKALNEHMKQVNSLIAQKKAALVDRLRTEVRIADVDQQLISAENLLSIRKRGLANLMGIKDSGTFTIKGILEKKDFAIPNIETSFKTALQYRQDYQAARLAVEAAERGVAAARGGHWPSISLKANYGRRWAEDPEEYPAGAEKSGEQGWAGIFVDLPVFEGGRISAKVHEQQAALAKTRERLRTLELSIRLDVETAILTRETAGKRIQTAEKSIKQAEESLQIERQKYNFGKGTITDVLDAQSAMLGAHTNYYRALADYNTAIAQLQLATGETK